MCDPSADELYNHVISDVVNSATTIFGEEGVDLGKVAKLRTLLEKKLGELKGSDGGLMGAGGVGAARAPPPPAHHPSTHPLSVLNEENAQDGDDSLYQMLMGNIFAPPAYMTHENDLQNMTGPETNTHQVDGTGDTSRPRKQSRREAASFSEDDNFEEDFGEEDDVELEAELDDKGSEPEEITNLVLTQYEKVSRTKNNWKCTLVNGIVHLNGTDYVFQKANGSFQW